LAGFEAAGAEAGLASPPDEGFDSADDEEAAGVESFLAACL
jgi:hypothetical protein